MASSRTEALGARLLDSLRLLPGSGTAWIAFSGGADSTAILAALHAVRDLSERPFAAVHVDHQWHPDSRVWAEHCAAVCAALGVPFRCLRVSVAAPPEGGPEGALREARYAALAGLLAPGELLVTAHHREDQAITLLLNALRGAGSRGLAGMPRRRPLGAGTLVRPVLDEDPAELRACARESALGWIEDPGNLDSGLDRNFLTREVLPLLQSRWPQAVGSLARSAEHAASDARLLERLGASLLRGRSTGDGVLSLDPQWLQDADTLRLAVSHWLHGMTTVLPPGRRLDEFCRQLVTARGDRGVRLDWAGSSLRHWQARLWLLAETPPDCPELEWNGRDPLSLGGPLGHIEIRGGTGLPWTLHVGPRRGGERLAAGGGHHRRVKELMRCCGVPPWYRASVPMLFRDGEPLAVGDWALAPELDQTLRATGAELLWIPAHPALAGLRAACHLAPVESAA